MSTLPAQPAAQKWNARAAFQYRDFVYFQSSRLLAVLASEMLAVAVGWQVYQITHRALDLGLVGLMQFAPELLLLLFTGHAADRFDRSRVYMTCLAGLGLAAGLLAAISWRPLRSAAPIFAVLVFLGVARAFARPATQSLTPQLVPAQHFSNAVSWGATFFQVATIGGPALGGLIYAWAGGPAGVYVTATALFISAALLMTRVKTRTGRMEGKAFSTETLLAGIRYVWENKLILGSISLDLFAVLLGGAVALLPIYAEKILHVGPRGLGLLRSAPAVGAMVMAVSLAYRPMRKKAGALMLLCVAIFGVATIVFGLSHSFALSLLALVIVGASDMVSVVVRQTLVQLSTPSAMRGRVSAVNMVFIGASNELGQFESGITAQWFGAVPAVIIGGVGTIAVVLLWAIAFPTLRKFEDLHAEAKLA